MSNASLAIIVPAISRQQFELFVSNNDLSSFRPYVVVRKSSLHEFASADEWINLVVQEDSGIYDAINAAVAVISETHYLVAGCDDVVYFESALEALRQSSEASVLSGNVSIGGRLHSKMTGLLAHAHKALISEHSVGTIFATQLHDEIGLYDSSLRIASDAKFVLQLYYSRKSFVYSNVLFGVYSGTGLSSSKYFVGQFELLRCYLGVKPLHGCIFSLFFLLRVFRYVSKLGVGLLLGRRKY